MLKMDFWSAKTIRLIFLVWAGLVPFFSLGAREEITSHWVFFFESNVPLPIQEALVRELEKLPTRKLSLWEKNFWRETAEDLERQKVITQSAQASAESQFDPLSSPTRKRSFEADYKKSQTPAKKIKQPLAPSWGDFHFQKVSTPSLNDHESATGLIHIVNLSEPNNDLFILKVIIQERDKYPPWEKELAFSALLPAIEIASQTRDVLSREVLGYRWVRITPRVDPEEAQLTLKGNLIALTDKRLLFWPQDQQPLNLGIVKEGYESFEQTIRLKEGETYSPLITLKPLELKEYEIITDPEGADIYLDNLWIGQSPFIFEASPKDHFLTLQIDGLKPKTIPLDKLNSKIYLDLNLDLEKENMARLKHHRIRFYASLSTLLLSLIPTAVFISLDLQAYKLQEMGNPVNRTLTQGLLWGSVSLNVGALIWNMVESILYIQQAEKSLKP